MIVVVSGGSVSGGDVLRDSGALFAVGLVRLPVRFLTLGRAVVHAFAAAA